MRMLLVCGLLICAGCKHAVPHHAGVTREKQKMDSILSVARAERAQQKSYIAKYERFLEKIARGLNLSANPTWEDYRRAVVNELRLPSETPWERVLEHPTIKNELTERKRLEFAEVFRLPRTASWPDIKDAIEDARRRHE